MKEVTLIFTSNEVGAIHNIIKTAPQAILNYEQTTVLLDKIANQANPQIEPPKEVLKENE